MKTDPLYFGTEGPIFEKRTLKAQASMFERGEKNGSCK